VQLPLTRDVRRILDVDIENRPSSYWYDGQTTAEVTAIAWAFTDKPKDISVRVLDPDDSLSMENMLYDFLNAYDEAYMVTGHYIRKHDLPILNGAIIENGFLPLSPKMTSDTKLDLIRYSDQPKTQEYLGRLMDTKASKVHMDQADWREANRLTPEGLAKTKKRVIGDVRQHIQLRAALIERGMLTKPKLWKP